MIACLYLLFALFTGFVMCELFFPALKTITEKTYRGEKLDLSSLLIRFPAWLVTGTVTVSWVAYIGACIFSNVSEDPLLYGDITAFVIAALVIAGGFTILIKKGLLPDLKTQIKKISPAEWLLMFFSLLLSILLMYRTLNSDGENLYVGLSVFSDFTPHISMVRSFSYMGNFPTQYTVCAGSDVKYHFMFTFLVGNLEFLGMRIDHAFNIPSILGLFCAFMVLYVLAVKITGKSLAGVISCLMFAFRSSAAFLLFLAGIPKGQVIETLKTSTDFIGVTPHEDWGLWNLNVYLNQRHFGFALVLLLILITVYLEPLYQAAGRIGAENAGSFFKKSLFSKEGWLPTDIISPVFSGLMLGAIGFWNGAVLIATVTVLFFIAVFADRRLEYLITAFLAGILSVIQTKTFIDGNAIKAEYRYGFLSENPTVFGSCDYIIKLLGLLPVVLVISFIVMKTTEKYVLFAFSTPLIFAFTVSMTPDIAVNHKYVMVSVMLMNIFAAWLFTMLIGKKDAIKRAAAVFMLVCLLSTGVYDLLVILRRDRQENSIAVELGNEVTDWIKDNCSSRDLFLTSNIYLQSASDSSRVILSGASLYDAWQYFGWSAGYDTYARDLMVAATYGAEDEKTLRYMVSRCGFDYVVIDRAVRENAEFEVNEMLFDRTYPIVFTAHEGMDTLKIYKTSE